MLQYKIWHNLMFLYFVLRHFICLIYFFQWILSEARPPLKKRGTTRKRGGELIFETRKRGGELILECTQVQGSDSVE